jgi:hypothetical protein
MPLLLLVLLRVALVLWDQDMFWCLLLKRRLLGPKLLHKYTSRGALKVVAVLCPVVVERELRFGKEGADEPTEDYAIEKMGGRQEKKKEEKKKTRRKVRETEPPNSIS